MPNGKQADREFQNAVEQAVEKLGGATATAIFLKVSGTTVHQWKRDGRMPTDTDEARKRLIKLARKSGVSALGLAGLEDAENGGGRKSRCLPTADDLSVGVTTPADAPGAAASEVAISCGNRALLRAA